MQIQNYNVVGVMSGTSLDGIDLAHLHFTFNGRNWSFEIAACETVAYNVYWQNMLKNAVGYSQSQLEALNSDYTKLLAETITEFISKHQIENLDSVCSHGHTILHQPQEGLTLQIGNLPDLALLTGQTVICNFRVQDVKLGGQGAPLVPIGDRLLFSDYDYCLNLGGFSNVSFEEKMVRIAFDISPVNTVLNFYADMLGFDYDDGGRISRDGQINDHLLEELDALEYYQKNHPKSLGVEFVKGTMLPMIENFDIPIEDILRTFNEHIAVQIALALPTKTGKMLITGGGAYNTFLIERIEFHLPKMQMIIPTKKILEFKEALIFGLLGVLRLRNEINVLSSVTGASHDHSSGMIYLK